MAQHLKGSHFNEANEAYSIASPGSRFATREQWLEAFADAARPHFARVGAPLPRNVRISVGFPSAGARGNAIGECWSSIASADGYFEIFLRPSLERDARVADVLTHELVHAAVGLEAKHGPKFKRCATALGLTGKMTATVAGDGWREWALPILADLGAMPGAPLAEMQSGRKKQGTRLIKCECDACGFTFRTTRKHLDANAEGLRCPSPECDGEMRER
ncbi:transcription elongation protein SprT [Novosphingobium sp. FGD1]|uniref:Transcription elongation protein SprT n=1 Tax=Novosphingobium silvae TaxID=2692619 RepID=A0A7X4GG86_9SPHN|nr:SprT-like domain-containing protein [Novosphingobium silvae]MYL97217.1 transcription elongation protein SprT [Novosphingobium silvae]